MTRWALLLWLAISPALADTVEFTKSELARIAAHGPWPPPPGVDAANRYEARPEAIEFGRQLFFDKRLSSHGQLACVSCHDPDLGFQDGRRFSRHGRNTMSLLDAGQQRWFRWDGAADSLWAASLIPLTAADEIAATPQHLFALFSNDNALARQYRRVFGAPVANETLLVNVAKALAAYQATLVSPRTSFDDFRDALARGDKVAASRYPAAAQRGLKIFVGSGRCFFCHTGPAFTNGEFADIGRPFFSPDGVDPGRWGGLQHLFASAYNRLGAHSDAPPDDARAIATRHVVQEPRHYGEFKVPGLRGLLATAPYFHDGSAATLGDVVRHYSELDESRLHADGVRLLRALRLSASQAADLTEFLKSLSRPAAGRQP